ncbi:ion transmembrane transporter [Aureococcus anophagefferens]|nr:ion transmembrane transporter [Aureococcus anophagefferens]
MVASSSNDEQALKFYTACFDGNLEEVQRIVKETPNLDLNRVIHGGTAFAAAVQNSHLDMVNLERPNANGNTPFAIAQHRRLDIAEALLQHGVNIAPVNKKGSTPFFFACQEGNLDVVKFLVRNGAETNTGKNGISPFHMACYRGHLDVVTYLGAPKHGDADLWRAARALHAKTTADGADPRAVPPGGWACFGSVPVSALILTAKYAPTSLPLFAAGHWLNQSHLASVSYFNRPPGKPAPLWRLGTAYCAAIGSAIGVFLAWKRVVVRFPALAGLGIFAAPAAGANMVNTVVMRFQELEDGVEVFDDRGTVVGVSHVAARSAVFDTCVTRLALPAGNFILTPLAYLALERGTPLGRAVARRPWLALPTQLATTVACFALCVPGSLALYPPVVAVPAAEPRAPHRIELPGRTILRYSKGIKIYLSENYTDDLTDNKIALPCMGVCNCWRDRGTQKTQCCNYSPRWRPRYWLATRTPLGPEREVTSPRSELPVLTEAARRRARTQTAGERLRAPTPRASTSARADASRACELAPTSAVAHYRRGVAEFELGNFEAAVGAFVLGLRSSPASTDLLRAREAAMTSLRARPCASTRSRTERRAEAERDADIEAHAAERKRLSPSTRGAASS